MLNCHAGYLVSSNAQTSRAAATCVSLRLSTHRKSRERQLSATRGRSSHPSRQPLRAAPGVSRGNGAGARPRPTSPYAAAVSPFAPSCTPLHARVLVVTAARAGLTANEATAAQNTAHRPAAAAEDHVMGGDGLYRLLWSVDTSSRTLNATGSALASQVQERASARAQPPHRQRSIAL